MRQADDYGRASGADDHPHAGNPATRGDAGLRARWRKVGLSHMAISRIWHTLGRNRIEPDVQAVERRAAAREGPRYSRPVSGSRGACGGVCVDEKPQIQALDRTQPLLPMQPSGTPDA
jgi:hypothetical protein